MDLEIDQLFTVDPEQFTATRDAIVKRLKADKKKDEAAAVAALRRPTALLWAMNITARSNPALVAALADAGANALDAQSNVMSGGSMATLNEAIDVRRSVIAQLINDAVRVLQEKEIATDPLVIPMRAAFEVASIDTEIMAALLVGRLTAVPVTADERNAPKPQKKEPTKSHLSVVRNEAEAATETSHETTSAEPVAVEVAALQVESIESIETKIASIAVDPTPDDELLQRRNSSRTEMQGQQEQVQQEQVQQEHLEKEQQEKEQQEREQQEKEQQEQQQKEQQRIADEEAENTKRRAAALVLREHFAKEVSSAQAALDEARQAETDLVETESGIVAAIAQNQAAIDRLQQEQIQLQEQLHVAKQGSELQRQARQIAEQALADARARAQASELAFADLDRSPEG
jgi:hypothetical protein